MKRPSRKIALHLTPLLDLLLIVIFAQYMEVRQQETSTLQAAEAAAESREEAVTRLANLQEMHELASGELARAQQQAVELSMRNAQLREEAMRTEQALEQVRAQQRVVGELLTELYAIPQEDVERILDPTREPPIADSPEAQERLRQRFREMAEQDSGRMIMHLLSYEEIRKRCDVWKLHIDENNVATLDTGSRTFRFRVVPEQFEDHVFGLYKSLPQPKGLVIILYTYDRDTRVSITETIGQALQDLVGRMREDSGNRTRFEYADLGIRPE
ncbi:hypothetical protein Mal4_06620 [Maioricimonas rarisocia]|uniref:Uncharacterized protein n=1 Tax=Maioricimonas rarisocia TaxID=2528026 RepID=A0A517Z1M0_9PLAN|nr:hypothetical protein [Maioricimonas rarisocia]QDU36377.1 hypothetical protein Mal4_06620 [Maioricimonas rarisocia]